ncbi:MAG: BT_3928 family protein [Sphingomonadales bacterium]
MKTTIIFIRWFVGLLFIFSGLVKANDPLGLSYKMQEFFEVWQWHGFNDYTLVASVVLNSFEIMAGAALLAGFAMRYVSWLLLLLILVFTALTGYTFFTGMPKNCGCFGDCLPISSGVSFGKDVVLTVLIAVLLLLFKQAKQDLSIKRAAVVVVSTLFSVLLQFYSLSYLPPVDCLPYKQGSNISEGMKMPSNAIADSFIIEFTYRKNGKEIRFPASDFPADFSSDYEFVKREDKLVRKGSNNEPPIKSFALMGSSGVDSTTYILQTEQSLWIWASSVKSFEKWREDLNGLINLATDKGLPIFFITSQPKEAVIYLSAFDMKSIRVLSCDLKAIQTAARVDPTIMLVKKGTIEKKKSLLNWRSVIE